MNCQLILNYMKLDKKEPTYELVLPDKNLFNTYVTNTNPLLSFKIQLFSDFIISKLNQLLAVHTFSYF